MLYIFLYMLPVHILPVQVSTLEYIALVHFCTIAYIVAYILYITSTVIDLYIQSIFIYDEKKERKKERKKQDEQIFVHLFVHFCRRGQTTGIGEQHRVDGSCRYRTFLYMVMSSTSASNQSDDNLA